MSELAKQLRGEVVTKLPLQSGATEPLKYDISHGAFSNLYFTATLAKFGNVAFARSSACMEFESFLRKILGTHRRGGVCLEIGTYQGMSAVILSQFFDKVICVSVDEDMRRIIKNDIVSYLGLSDKIIFHDVKGLSEKRNIINRLDFDFAYVDGDHVNETYSDFEMVKRCGRVLFHEAWPLQPPVWNLVHSLPSEEVTWADYDCFAYWEQWRG